MKSLEFCVIRQSLILNRKNIREHVFITSSTFALFWTPAAPCVVKIIIFLPPSPKMNMNDIWLVAVAVTFDVNSPTKSHKHNGTVHHEKSQLCQGTLLRHLWKSFKWKGGAKKYFSVLKKHEPCKRSWCYTVEPCMLPTATLALVPKLLLQCTLTITVLYSLYSISYVS